jgi:hypothetical protein
MTPVGAAEERRFADLAKLLAFLVADATGGSEGADGNSETLDTA